MREQIAAYSIVGIFIVVACIFGATLHQRNMFKQSDMSLGYYLILIGSVLVMGSCIWFLVLWGYTH